jgi:hypothetical protein
MRKGHFLVLEPLSRILLWVNRLRISFLLVAGVSLNLQAQANIRTIVGMTLPTSAHALLHDRVSFILRIRSHVVLR